MTQTTLGFSRDDAEKRFLSHYLDEKILATNPFETLDQGGVEISCASRSSARPRSSPTSSSICGEHGGDPRSVAFCHELGLDYELLAARVLARLAAAQAALAEAGVTAVAVGG